MKTSALRTLLVPGAWMGAWVWEPTRRRLAQRGFEVESVTLRGLEPGQPYAAIAAVRLEDHVQQLVDHVTALGGPVVLVSHSYSAMPAAIAADRLGGRVRGLVHVGGFLPVDGRSLLDDWGTGPEERERERADIAAAGGVWLPPGRDALAGEPDLAPARRDALVERFTAHPGRTVTDPARLSRPVSAQPTTYVALSPQGAEQAWRRAPRAATQAPRWRRRHLSTGHWPMVAAVDTMADLLAEEIGLHALERG